jgi:hypothetical protein
MAADSSESAKIREHQFQIREQLPGKGHVMAAAFA